MTAPAYDRELIARMLDEAGSPSFTLDALREQAALLRAADNADAAGVRTVNTTDPVRTLHDEVTEVLADAERWGYMAEVSVTLDMLRRVQAALAQQPEANQPPDWYARREEHARAMGYVGLADALDDLDRRKAEAPAQEAVAWRCMTPYGIGYRFSDAETMTDMCEFVTRPTQAQKAVREHMDTTPPAAQVQQDRMQEIAHAVMDEAAQVQQEALRKLFADLRTLAGGETPDGDGVPVNVVLWAEKRLAALAQAPAVRVTDETDSMIEQAMLDGFRVAYCPPHSALTDDANRETAWSVERYRHPFKDAAGNQRWFAPTLREAIVKARAALEAAIGQGKES